MVFRMFAGWKLASVVAVPAVVAAGLAWAQQPTDMTGAWKGTGFVQQNDTSNKMGVRCQVTGQQSGDDVGFAGKCRAMLVVSRDIGADIKRDGERFYGTYIGSIQGGKAQLEGTRVAPDRIELEMTFERAVNGDDKAKMVIMTSGNDAFSIETRDVMESGATVTTASVSFERE